MPIDVVSNKSLAPHPGKSEVLLLSKGTLREPHAPIQLGTLILRCVTKRRLLGMTVDPNLSWVPNALEIKISFTNKLNLLKRSGFLLKGVLQDTTLCKIWFSFVGIVL